MISFFDENRFKWQDIVLASILFILSFYCYLSRFDLDFHLWNVEHFKTPMLQHIFGLLSRAGQAWFQIVACIPMGIYYYRKGHYQMSRVWYLSIVIFLGCGIIGNVFKLIFGRPRPKMLSHDMYAFEWWEIPAKLHSYPSGHTLTTFCLLATVFPFYGRKIQGLLLVIACALGYARIGIGAHYLGDVIAGATLGYVIGKYLRIKLDLSKKVI